MVGAELCLGGGGGAGIRLAGSVVRGGGGAFLVGCEDRGLRGTTGGCIDVPNLGVDCFTAEGGVSSRVPANRSKSAKSRMIALGAEQEKSDNSGASGGDVETGASFSCVAIFSWLLNGAGTGRDAPSPIEDCRTG